MLLRLHELPPGYLVGDDSGCGPMSVEDAPAELATFVIENRPRGCSFRYERLYRLPGRSPYPALVETMAFTVATDEAASEGFELAPQMIAYETGIERLAEEQPPEMLGEATRWFHTDDALVDGHGHKPGTIVAWRFGRVLAFLVVAGQTQIADDRISLLLAPRQHSHVEQPTPYTRWQYDDTLVPLDNPGLRLPVYWLGRMFNPGHGLRTARLEQAFGPIRGGEGPPGERLELSYRSYLNLGVWPRAGWGRLQKTSLGRELAAAPCTTSTKLRLRRGHAIVYASYARGAAAGPPMPLPSPSRRGPARRPQTRSAQRGNCSGRRPNRFIATAYIGRVVVAVNLPVCVPCAREPGYGPFNSLRAMKAIVRSLRFRAARRG